MATVAQSVHTCNKPTGLSGTTVALDLYATIILCFLPLASSSPPSCPINLVSQITISDLIINVFRWKFIMTTRYEFIWEISPSSNCTKYLICTRRQRFQISLLSNMKFWISLQFQISKVHLDYQMKITDNACKLEATKFDNLATMVTSTSFNDLQIFKIVYKMRTLIFSKVICTFEFYSVPLSLFILFARKLRSREYQPYASKIQLYLHKTYATFPSPYIYRYVCKEERECSRSIVSWRKKTIFELSIYQSEL